MLTERINKIRLLTHIYGLSINTMYLHIINKSKINNFVDKNIDKKLVMTKKKDYLCCKKKGKEDLLFLKGFLLFTVYDQPLLDKVQ